MKFSNITKRNLNTKTKEIAASLGAARALILKAIEQGAKLETKDKTDCTMFFSGLLEQSKQADKYKVLLRYVKPSKSGKYPVWFVLNTLNKHSEQLQAEFSKIDVKLAKQAA